MPNIKSQIKRVKITQKQNAINTAKRTKVRGVIKKYTTAIDNKDVALAESLLNQTISIIDSAKSDGIYHKNTAARKVVSINKMLTTLKAETATKA